jgi:hypothetical protein
VAGVSRLRLSGVIGVRGRRAGGVVRLAVRVLIAGRTFRTPVMRVIVIA